MLSDTGVNVSLIAFPLLAFAITGSPAATGLVGAVNALAQLVAGLPGGALVDRWNRKWIMVGCEAVRLGALLSLALALVDGSTTVPHILVVSLLLGLCGALFEPAEEASLPHLVPAAQLPTAVALNGARGFIGHLVGTSAGGALYGIGRVAPFVAGAITHVVSLVLLLFLRLPAPVRAPAPASALVAEMAEGLRWVWRHRLIRATAGCAIGLNLLFQALFVIVLVLAQQRGVPAGEIGVMAAMLGVGGLVGSLAAPALCRVLSPYLSIVGVFWALALLTPVILLVDDGFPVGLVFAAMAFLAPTANTTVSTYQLLLTPDGLRGRTSGVIGLVAGVSAALGPALGGLLLQWVGGTRAVIAVAAAMSCVAAAATFGPSLRSFPSRTDLSEEPDEHAAT